MVDGPFGSASEDWAVGSFLTYRGELEVTIDFASKRNLRPLS